MIQFTINSFSHGLTGRPYKSINEAIQDGGYSVCVMKKINLRLVLGTARKKTLKDIAKTISVKL